jgi:hypothetical protein
MVVKDNIESKQDTVGQEISSLPWDSPDFYRRAHALAAKRVQFVEHKGKRMLVTDCAGADAQLMKAVAAECLHVVSRQEPKSLRTLIDVSGADFVSETTNMLAELATKNRPYVMRSAVIGVTGLRFFALQFIITVSKRQIKLFDGRSQALDWLAQDDASE